MANLQIKIEDQLREQAQEVAANLGIDLPSAVRLFLAQMVRENGLPFKPSVDPFYSPINQFMLKKSIDDLKAGKGIVKSIEELESMAK